MKDVESGRTLPVPEHLRDSHYQGAKRLGHGKAPLCRRQVAAKEGQRDFVGGQTPAFQETFRLVQPAEVMVDQLKLRPSTMVTLSWGNGSLRVSTDRVATCNTREIAIRMTRRVQRDPAGMEMRLKPVLNARVLIKTGHIGS